MSEKDIIGSTLTSEELERIASKIIDDNRKSSEPSERPIWKCQHEHCPRCGSCLTFGPYHGCTPLPELDRATKVFEQFKPRKK